MFVQFPGQEWSRPYPPVAQTGLVHNHDRLYAEYRLKGILKDQYLCMCKTTHCSLSFIKDRATVKAECCFLIPARNE